MILLEQIEKANDIKKIDKEKLPELASEIRAFLIEKISRNGGHLASNLGVVELTIALHRVLNFPEDKLIWDVGHQSYTHKILTGRRDGFDKMRKYGGMSGFPKRKESDCDAFDTGHSSTSISAGLGYVEARDLQKQDYTVVSVIGDGALTGGMAYEALNNAARLEKNFIIVLNDNNMSISENVGGISAYLSNIRTADSYTGLKNGLENTLRQIPVYGDRLIKGIRSTKQGIKQFLVPGMFFEEMGITYLGPVDGHNIAQVTRVLNDAKKVNGAVLVHVITKKGKGYGPAERMPSRFHGAEPFDIETGLPVARKKKAGYTDVFSTVMCKMGAKNPKLVAITAAMPDGTGLKRFRNMYRDRFFDVGIAEGHAVTFAAGLAAGGMKPVVAVYSSFLQRGFDQVIHDVCIQNLPVVFAIDRAGLVGSDGETHQGIFDLSYLSAIPNMCLMAPVVYGKSELLYDECGLALVAVGSMVKTALQVREMLKGIGYSCTIVNGRFVKPVDEEMLQYLAADHSMIVTMEENVKSGGFGEKVLEYYNETGADVQVLQIALPDDYIEHGNVDVLKQETCIDAESIFKRIVARYQA